MRFQMRADSPPLQNILVGSTTATVLSSRAKLPQPELVLIIMQSCRRIDCM